MKVHLINLQQLCDPVRPIQTRNLKTPCGIHATKNEAVLNSICVVFFMKSLWVYMIIENCHEQNVAMVYSEYKSKVGERETQVK